MKKKHVFLINPLLSGYMLIANGICFGTYIIFDLDKWSSLVGGATLKNRVGMFCILVVPIILAETIWADSFFGLWVIREDGITLHNLFRKPRKLAFSKVAILSIDFCIISQYPTHNKQFWLYLATEPIERNYFHRINAMPMTDSCIRCVYSTKLGQILMEYMPDNLQRQLVKSQSVLRTYGYEE